MRVFSVLATVCSLTLILVGGCSMPTETANVTTDKSISAVGFQEKHRPQYHFSPQKNWMNDPNGMVYYDGEYHLFYQYHPDGTEWGPMHWAHAVSPDMLHWEHLPIAIYPDEQGTIFSGSAVVDWNNTSGLGSIDNPPMVAIYTYHNVERADAGHKDFQSQAIAYSTDKGRTWIKYADNPVLSNPGMEVYRDPKVSWYAPENKWIMVLAQGDHIGFYSSKNLIDWTPESTFGQSWGEHEGIWECPDLIRMKVEGTDDYKYVLLVSIYPGAPNGGSGTQYFVGDFDGSEFKLDPTYQSLLKQTPEKFPDGDVYENFENGFDKWRITGNAFGDEPTAGGYEKQNNVHGHLDEYLANSYLHGDKSTGSLTSETFLITKPFINFYIGGGSHQQTAINLLVEGAVVKSMSGKDRGTMSIASWDVNDFVGKRAQLQIVDFEKEGWGLILVDQIVFSEQAAEEKIEPAMWIDYGTDNYAGVTFSDIPEADGRHLFMAWVNNWQYANQVPTEGWRGAMTLPRKLSLQNNDGLLKLISTPVKELDALSKNSGNVSDVLVTDTVKITDMFDADLSSSHLKMRVWAKQAQSITLRYASSENEYVDIELNIQDGQLILDRTKSGNTAFERRFASVQYAPLPGLQKEYEIDVFYDSSILEIFVNGGETAMTVLVFPSEDYQEISLSTASPVVLESVSLAQLKGVWNNKI